MISIIICSVDTNLLHQVSNSIKDTVGVEHEIITIDNKEGDFNICQAYNIGASKSKYDILVYVHEDVIFHTTNWGEVIIRYFKDIPKLGCIGIAGASQKTKAPSAWWNTEHELRTLHIIHHLQDKTKSLESYGWEDGKSYKEVVIVDGVFMVTKKSIGFKFDTSIPGFHCYDLNLTIELKRRGYKVITTKDILIEHFSLGKLNKQWVEAYHFYHKKYSNLLPLAVNADVVTLKQLEASNLLNFIDISLTFNLRKIATYYWVRLFFVKPPTLEMQLKFTQSLFKGYNHFIR